jgi:hypothetical protein
MSSVVISGNTSGTVTLDAPAVAGTTVLTLPATSGTVIVGTSGVTSVASGGTGASTLTLNNVILGNGTTAVKFVAPGTTGNLLTSDGTTWTSAAAPAGGVTSFIGQTGAVDPTTSFAIGSVVNGRPNNYTDYAVGSTLAGSSIYVCSTQTCYFNGGWIQTYINASYTPTVIGSGSWRCVSRAYASTGGSSQGDPGLWMRYA